MIIYLALINYIAFFMMKRDKRNAQKQKRRIPEKNLWLVALIGGAFGATLAMFQFRHKTKHVQFRIGLPLLTILQIGLIIYFFK
ncbi:DUF1294 domain-containing protein [Gracilibacillus alcaliphilus]|uniref:DUF1294 domain-containing protein n=1 Tax=Gracilibacillus alcaliphilus TaxID=1401441 RepID=UPI00195D3D57|nr:DUF1294 domain-containing protein [Gracilibacillus alcaliphilus]MBM7676931.1 uncharacterized membrane protein YsdA (DUF1294 family) [Gracilibacillus alcaliphilus]